MRSKLKKIGAMVAVACMALTSSAVELDLAGEWMLLGSNEVGAAISCPIAVPGDTHSALLAGELIPDPFWGCNETNIQWIGRHDWTVRRSFTVSPELLSKKVARASFQRNAGLFAIAREGCLSGLQRGS